MLSFFLHPTVFPSQDGKTWNKYLLEMEGKSCGFGIIFLGYLLTQESLSTSTSTS